MEELRLYLKDINSSDEEVIIVNELIQFFNDEKASIDNLVEIEEKIDLVKYKLNSVFSNLLYNKINLIKKENDLNSLFVFLFTEFETYEEFSKKIDTSIDEFRKFIARSYGLYFQDSKMYLKIQEKLDFLEREEQKYRIKKFKLYDEFLWVYLNSRYYTSNIKKMTGVSPNEFLKAIEANDLKDNYPEDIKDVIEEKIDLLSRLKISRVSDLVPIRDMELIKIVKSDVLKVSSKDYKGLEVVLEYLRNYGNIDKMGRNYKYNHHLVLSILDKVKLSDLLNKDTLEKLNNYSSACLDLSMLSVKERGMLVKNMIIKYYKCNGNLVKLIESEKNEELVLRLLNDDIANVILGDREYEKVLMSLKEYSEKEDVIKILAKIREPLVIKS